MKGNNELYTTVAISDFKDDKYINQLLELSIGIEVALLTKLSNQLNSMCYEKDLNALKKEITDFKSCLNQFKVLPYKVRIHQPGGYTYYWSDENNGFVFLKDFFSFCYDLGFRNYVIHIPYGNSKINLNEELNEYREKLGNLIPVDAYLEVEEISVSYDELEDSQNMRFYNGILFEKLMEGQKAKMLLDTYECGGINKTIYRIKNLTSKGFEIKSVHLHKDKHKFLTCDEVELLLKSNFYGNLINEGFLREESSFDEFVETKSINCVVPNNQRIEILKSYYFLLKNKRKV